MAQAALDAAVAHAATREAFGRPLSTMQGISHQLADVATRVQASRLLVHAAASAYDAGVTPITEAAAMAKLFATETAMLAVDVAIQVHGASALERGHLLEHLYRDVRAHADLRGSVRGAARDHCPAAVPPGRSRIMRTDRTRRPSRRSVSTNS